MREKLKALLLKDASIKAILLMTAVVPPLLLLYFFSEVILLLIAIGSVIFLLTFAAEAARGIVGREAIYPVYQGIYGYPP
jgi:hypothetical protein